MARLIAVFLLVFGLVIAGVAISRIDRGGAADGATQQQVEQESTLSLLALPLLAGVCLSAGVVLFVDRNGAVAQSPPSFRAR